MIELYTYATSNGQRASVMLEECGLPYKAIKVDQVRELVVKAEVGRHLVWHGFRQPAQGVLVTRVAST